jgi:hypothetical protein
LQANLPPLPKSQATLCCKKDRWPPRIVTVHEDGTIAELMAARHVDPGCPKIGKFLAQRRLADGGQGDIANKAAMVVADDRVAADTRIQGHTVNPPGLIGADPAGDFGSVVARPKTQKIAILFLTGRAKARCFAGMRKVYGRFAICAVPAGAQRRAGSVPFRRDVASVSMLPRWLSIIYRNWPTMSPTAKSRMAASDDKRAASVIWVVLSTGSVT